MTNSKKRRAAKPAEYREVIWTSSRNQKFTDAQLEALVADPNVEFLADGRFRRTTRIKIK